MVAQSPATDFHTAHLRKLQGVPHQVTYDLGKTHAVHHQTALRQPFYKLHLNARGMRAHILRRTDFINQRVYIHFSIVIFQSICLNLRVVQQVIDQLQQRVLVIINLLQKAIRVSLSRSSISASIVVKPTMAFKGVRIS